MKVQAGDVLAKIPRETNQGPRTSPAVCRAFVRTLRDPQTQGTPAVISENRRARSSTAILPRGMRKVLRRKATMARPPRNTPFPRAACTSTFRKATTSRPARALIDGPLQPARLARGFWARRFTQSYLVNAIQGGFYRLQGVNINDKHIETILAPR